MIFAAWVSGEAATRSALPSGVSGSPTRARSIATIGAQYGGIEASSVRRFDGPTMSTPHANTSGVIASPTSVA